MSREYKIYKEYLEIGFHVAHMRNLAGLKGGIYLYSFTDFLCHLRNNGGRTPDKVAIELLNKHL